MTEKHRHAGTPAPELDAQGLYNGLTALPDAVWHGHLEAAQALVDAGARLDLTTHAGLTPRALALLYGYDDLARLLAEAERVSLTRQRPVTIAPPRTNARTRGRLHPTERNLSMTDAIHAHPFAFPDTALDRLHEKGLLDDPKNKNTSVALTDEGVAEAAAAFRRLFGVDG